MYKYGRGNFEKTFANATANCKMVSENLRRVFPILITAMKGYVGTNTGKKIELEILEESPDVFEIKGITPESSDTKEMKDKL